MHVLDNNHKKTNFFLIYYSFKSSRICTESIYKWQNCDCPLAQSWRSDVELLSCKKRQRSNQMTWEYLLPSTEHIHTWPLHIQSTWGRRGKNKKRKEEEKKEEKQTEIERKQRRMKTSQQQKRKNSTNERSEHHKVERHQNKANTITMVLKKWEAVTPGEDQRKRERMHIHREGWDH